MTLAEHIYARLVAAATTEDRHPSPDHLAGLAHLALRAERTWREVVDYDNRTFATNATKES